MNRFFQLAFSLILMLFVTAARCQQPQFSVQALFGPTGYVWDNSGGDLKPGFNYSAGGFIQANIPTGDSRIFIRSGYFIDTKQYSIDVSNTSHWYKALNREFVYGNVPILFGVQFNAKDKIYPFISIGCVFSKVKQVYAENVWKDGTVSSGLSGKSTVFETPKDLYIGFGIDFRLNKFLFIRLEPFLSHQFNEGSGYNIDHYGRISYGIKLGASFDIFIPGLEKNLQDKK